MKQKTLTFLEVCTSFGVKKSRRINLLLFSKLKNLQNKFLKVVEIKKAPLDGAFFYIRLILFTEVILELTAWIDWLVKASMLQLVAEFFLLLVR